MGNPEKFGDKNEVFDIIENSRHKSLIDNLAQTFKKEGYKESLTEFLKKDSDSLPILEKKDHEKYSNLIKKIPSTYRLYKKNQKNENDYSKLLSKELSVFFSDQELKEIEDHNFSYEREKIIQKLKKAGIGKFETIVSIKEDISEIPENNLREVVSILNLLNEISPESIKAIETIDIEGELREQLNNFSANDIKKIIEIYSLYTQGGILIKSALNIDFVKKINSITSFAIKNGAININEYYSYNRNDSGLRGINSNRTVVGKVYSQEKGIEFPGIDKMEVFQEKHLKNLDDIQKGKITGKEKQQLKDKIKKDLKTIIISIQKEVGYIPWEYKRFYEQIDTLGKPNQKMIAFLKLFRSYLSSGVEEAWFKGDLENDQELIKKVEKHIKLARSGDFNKFNGSDIDDISYDSYYEDRLEDFYEYLREGLENNMKSNEEIENDGSSFFNEDLEDIDIFIEKHNFNDSLYFTFDRLKMAVATHMADESWAFGSDTNLKESWNLIRNEVIEEIEKNTESNIQEKIDLEVKEAQKNPDNNFEVEEVEAYKQQIKDLPLFTKENILAQSGIEYKKGDLADINNKLIDFFFINSRNIGIQFATEQKVILDYLESNNKLLGKISKNSGIKNYLGTFDDDLRDFKKATSMITTEALKFAITTALTAGAGVLVGILARGGAALAVGGGIIGRSAAGVSSGIGMATRTGGYLKNVSNTGGFMTRNAAKLTLGTGRVGKEVLAYTLISNWVDNGKFFSFDHFIENFALVGGGVAGLKVGANIIKPSSPKFTQILSKYLGASGGAMGGELLICFKDGREVDFLSLIKQGALMGAMMLPMSLGRKGGTKGWDKIEGFANRNGYGEKGFKSMEQKVTKKINSREKAIKKSKTEYTKTTRSLKKEITEVRNNSNFTLNKQKLNIHIEGLKQGSRLFEKISDPLKIINNFGKRYGSLKKLEVDINKKLLNKDLTKNETLKNELIGLKRHYTVWKALDSKLGKTYFQEQLKATKLKYRVKGETKNIADKTKNFGKTKLETLKENIAIKALKLRKGNLEYGQYSSEGMKLRDINGSYEGANIVNGNILKYKGAEVMKIPEGFNIKNIKTTEAAEGLISLKLEIKPPNGKNYEVTINNNGYKINETIAEIALKEKSTVEVIKNTKGEITHYKIKEGNKINYYSKSGKKTKRPSNRESTPLIKSVELNPIEQAKFIDQLKSMKNILSKENAKIALKYSGKAVKLTSSILFYMIKNPIKTVVIGAAGGATVLHITGGLDDVKNDISSLTSEKTKQATDFIVGEVEKRLKKNMSPEEIKNEVIEKIQSINFLEILK